MLWIKCHITYRAKTRSSTFDVFETLLTQGVMTNPNEKPFLNDLFAEMDNVT